MRDRRANWDRVRVVNLVREIVADPLAVLLDTETTGFSRESEVLEIAVVNTVDGVILLDTLVWPSGEIPLEATEVHGITSEDVLGYPEWPDVYGMLFEVLAGRRVVIWNKGFDIRIIRQTNTLWGIQNAILVPVVCAMKLYATYYGERRSMVGGYTWHKLEVAAARLGVLSGRQEHLGHWRIVCWFERFCWRWRTRNDWGGKR